MKKTFLPVLCILGMFCPFLAPAQAFDPNYLLSDEELFDAASLDLYGIQQYLNRGYLGTYETENFEGEVKSAAQIIYDAANMYGISPKFLLVLLQKEQSLIEDDDPSQTQLDWATGYAVCDICTTSTEAIQRWKGFGKQVNSASLQFIEGYIADLLTYGKTTANYAVDVPVIIDDVLVTPMNMTTAAMYSYTPHLHGNENFVAIWASFFSQEYPTGSLLQAKGEEGVWLISYGERRPITSYAALVSRYHPSSVIQVDASTLTQYSVGKAIAFPNYALLRIPSGTIYLLVDDTRRGIDSMETFRAIGFNEDEVIDVALEDVAAYEEGEPITIESSTPQGRLMQHATTGGVYFVEDGIKYPLISRTVLEVNFSGFAMAAATEELLATYATGDPILLNDGVLVKSIEAPDVYVISEGKRLPIPSGEIFEQMGWQWENVVVTDEKTLALHALGEAIADPLSETDEEGELSATSL